MLTACMCLMHPYTLPSSPQQTNLLCLDTLSVSQAGHQTLFLQLPFVSTFMTISGQK